MRNYLAALGLSTALAAATAVPLATEAGRRELRRPERRDLQHQIAPVEKAQFSFWDGNNWCWYPSAGAAPAGLCDTNGTTATAGAARTAGTAGTSRPTTRSGNGWWQYHNHHRHDHDRLGRIATTTITIVFGKGRGRLNRRKLDGSGQ